MNDKTRTRKGNKAKALVVVTVTLDNHGKSPIAIENCFDSMEMALFAQEFINDKIVKAVSGKMGPILIDSVIVPAVATKTSKRTGRHDDQLEVIKDVIKLAHTVAFKSENYLGHDIAVWELDGDNDWAYPVISSYQ